MISCMEKLNPFMKMVTVLAAAVMLGFNRSVVVNIIVSVVCLFCMLVLSRGNKIRILKVLIPISLVIFALFMAGYKNAGQSADNLNFTFGAAMGAMAGPVYIGLRLASRVMAYAGLGLLFGFTTSGEDFIMSLMQQGHLKPKFAYGILAALHLTPQIRAELEAAKLAYSVRGIHLPAISLKPFFAAMVNCMRWSEMMAMAMESKGFDGDGRRTCARELKIHLWDYIVSVLTLILILLGTVNSFLQIVPMW